VFHTDREEIDDKFEQINNNHNKSSKGDEEWLDKTVQNITNFL